MPGLCQRINSVLLPFPVYLKRSPHLLEIFLAILVPESYLKNLYLQYYREIESQSPDTATDLSKMYSQLPQLLALILPVPLNFSEASIS